MADQVEINKEEIKGLRIKAHDDRTLISKITFQHEDDVKNIEDIKKGIFDIKEDNVRRIELVQDDLTNLKDLKLTPILTDIGKIHVNIEWMRERYDTLDKKFWAVILMSLGTLLATVIDYLK